MRANIQYVLCWCVLFLDDLALPQFSITICYVVCFFYFECSRQLHVPVSQAGNLLCFWNCGSNVVKLAVCPLPFFIRKPLPPCLEDYPRTCFSAKCSHGDSFRPLTGNVPALYIDLGGGFIFFLLTPLYLGKLSNLTVAYFSDGLK